MEILQNKHLIECFEIFLQLETKNLFDFVILGHKDNDVKCGVVESYFDQQNLINWPKMFM